MGGAPLPPPPPPPPPHTQVQNSGTSLGLGPPFTALGCRRGPGRCGRGQQRVGAPILVRNQLRGGLLQAQQLLPLLLGLRLPSLQPLDLLLRVPWVLGQGHSGGETAADCRQLGVGGPNLAASRVLGRGICHLSSGPRLAFAHMMDFFLPRFPLTDCCCWFLLMVVDGCRCLLPLMVVVACTHYCLLVLMVVVVCWC